jgi:hypothetical protein
MNQALENCRHPWRQQSAVDGFYFRWKVLEFSPRAVGTRRAWLRSVTLPQKADLRAHLPKTHCLQLQQINTIMKDGKGWIERYTTGRGRQGEGWTRSEAAGVQPDGASRSACSEAEGVRSPPSPPNPQTHPLASFCVAGEGGMPSRSGKLQARRGSTCVTRIHAFHGLSMCATA